MRLIKRAIPFLFAVIMLTACGSGDKGASDKKPDTRSADDIITEKASDVLSSENKGSAALAEANANARAAYEAAAEYCERENENKGLTPKQVFENWQFMNCCGAGGMEVSPDKGVRTGDGDAAVADALKGETGTVHILFAEDSELPIQLEGYGGMFVQWLSEDGTLGQFPFEIPEGAEPQAGKLYR